MSDQVKSSPVAIASWPKLEEPQVYTEKGETPDPDDKGHYSVKLILDPKREKHAEWIQAVQDAEGAWIEEAIEKWGKKKVMVAVNTTGFGMPLKQEFDENGEPTGLMVCNFRCKAGGKKKAGGTWEYKLPLYRYGGEKFESPEGKVLTTGSKVAVSYKPRVWKRGSDFGVSFDMNAAMIIKPEFYEKRDGAAAFAEIEIDDEDFDGDEYTGDDGVGGNF